MKSARSQKYFQRESFSCCRNEKSGNFFDSSRLHFLRKYSDFKNLRTSNYLFKVNNGNTKPMCEICSKLTKKTPILHQYWLAYELFRRSLWNQFVSTTGYSFSHFDQIKIVERKCPDNFNKTNIPRLLQKSFYAEFSQILVLTFIWWQNPRRYLEMHFQGLI